MARIRRRRHKNAAARAERRRITESINQNAAAYLWIKGNAAAFARYWQPVIWNAKPHNSIYTQRLRL